MSANPLLVERLRFRQIRMPARRGLMRREPYTIATHIKIYIALIGTCGLLLYAFSPAVALILSGTLIGTPLLALGIVEARRDSLWLNPLCLFLLYLGTQLGPAAIWEGFELLSDGSLEFPLARISAADVATGYFLTLIGACVMSLGLRAFRPVPKLQLAHPIGWTPRSICVLYLLGIAAIYRPSAFLFFGEFGGILQWGPLAILLAFAFSTAGRRRLPSEKILFSAGMAIYFAASFFSENSSKSYTMLAFLPVIVLILGNKKYRKWIPAGAVSLAVFYLGVVAPTVNNSRTLNGRDSYHKIMTGFYSSSPFYSDRPFLLSMQDQLDQFMRRVFEMPPVAGFMVNEVKRSGFRLGGTMSNLYYAFIPRIVWHGKPPVSRGAWFTTYLRMAPREAEATTSTGMTIVGEWYWNFGAIGVVAGMFLTGLLLSGLWRMAGSYPIHQPANMLLYVAIIVNVLNLPDATSPLVSNIALYLLFGSLIYLHKFAQKMGTSARPRNIQPRVMTASNHF